MASFIKPILGSFKRILLMNLVSSPLNIPGLNFSFFIKEYLKKLLEDESWIQLYSLFIFTTRVLVNL